MAERPAFRGFFRTRGLTSASAEAITLAFERFDRAHPDVWALFVRFAEELRASGRHHYSADALLHRIRWELDTSAHHVADVRAEERPRGEAVA